MRLKSGVPVLARTQDCVQVGLRQPLILRDLPPTTRTFLASLEGRSSAVTAAEHAAFADVLTALTDAGFIDHHADAPNSPPLVRIRGLGPIGLTTAEVLARAGWISLSLVDDVAAHYEPESTFPLHARQQNCASAAVWTLRDRVPELCVTHDAASADLEIVTSVAAAPPQVVDALTVNGVPHLLVTADESGVDVGPLVVPGDSACSRCVALHQIDRDPEWALVAMQCATQRRPKVDSGTAALAGSLGAREALSFLSGAPAAGRQWRVDALPSHAVGSSVPNPAPALVPLPVEPHPACGCGASGPVGDELAAARARLPRGTATPGETPR